MIPKMTKKYAPFDKNAPANRASARGGQPYAFSQHNSHAAYDIHYSSGSQYSLASSDFNDGHSYDQKLQDAADRKRIPVACGRCRKRKIKCSGPGKGSGACSGCHGAGHEICEFNRVQSEAMGWMDVGPEYLYEPAPAAAAAPRYQYRQVSQYAANSSFGQTAPMAPTSQSLPYRPAPAADYPYNRSNWNVTSYGAHYGDTGDYPFNGNGYLAMGQEAINISYYPSNGVTRGGWTPVSQQTKQPAQVYHGPEAAISYGNALPQYASSSYDLRPATNVESNAFSFTNMANSLPPPATGYPTTADRLLPIPSNRPAHIASQGHNIIPLSRSADGLGFNNTLNKSRSSGSLMPAPQTTYLQVQSNSPESSQPTFNNGAEMYSSSSDGWNPGHELAHEASMRIQDTHNDMYSYGHNSHISNERKSSQSRQIYVPGQSSEDYTRAPSMDMGHTMAHQPSNGSLRAP